ncbi:MAG: dTDP-4-dehydrorhamnose 3,5-epimerase [Bdellovibrionales bacterium RIFOXYD12_FULL_39_22]|nr:MAG: dTDP-4-dehydrorhamnose 3,5-epimerase [Bdellovibrionales bacterium RIFOXYB1_FULL_39_21]OFZ41540.1 MAG: dTDP-4-dehydrorhamnose 3,5-epimerase [Bdellovibrionales bacterium RIFOXYC12_FULL_39_17]OFZ45853.1 MAG: dTDP-4-dehydrorhamnose 3,5-epimerase [Bdellovibrionales bacterium RIFOXYC1_FULL_39_130]OFZ72796.1 MAG: dTDP-4-dehydrorhamnose 3,5-epimerase [Bdellovibrionales bacterium RIFOXYC2_FULL_39_8]OFZ74785.1 MAG: dTDP-4-dehydrorhamnose 3,5-epimerase [Bdellovibrionales bacterium RIFOXYD1_FULL_39
MIFKETSLAGAFTIEPERREDQRGFFARTFCVKEFEQHNLDSRLVQANYAFSKSKGTLRGLHYQRSPMSETKIVHCIHGAIWDVIVDLRQSSPTFGKWFAEELTSNNRKIMYVPKGFAHGMLTLTDDVEVLYMVSEFYSPTHERGIRWNDPFLNIVWPNVPTIISAKDNSWSDFNPHDLLGSIT